MGHEVESLLGAYVLEALSSEERRQVDAHLRDCESCRRILASYKMVAEGLLHATDPKQPPKAIRARLLKQISPRSGLSGWRRSAQRIPAAGLALAIGLFVLLSVNIGLLLQSQRLLEQGEAAAAQQYVGQTAMAIASYPGAQVAAIEEDGVRGTFVYDPELPVAVMYVWGLQPPPENQDYQAWLVDAQGGRFDGGLLTFSDEPGFGWLLIDAPTSISEFSSLGVTLEPAGGSDAPTGARILGADL